MRTAEHDDERATHSRLKLRRVGIDTYQEAVIYMNRDCHVCRAEGFNAQSRVEVGLGSRRLIATFIVVSV
jgi:thymidine phosphorylase